MSAAPPAGRPGLGSSRWARGDARGRLRSAARAGVRAAGLHYPRSMHATALPAKPRGLALMLGWRRIRFTLGISIAGGLLLPQGRNSGLLPVLTRTVILGLIAMLMFGLFELWPKRLPQWLERWVLQVVSVALAMPISS